MYEFKISYLKGFKSKKGEDELREPAIWLAKSLILGINNGNKNSPKNLHLSGEVKVIKGKGCYRVQMIVDDQKKKLNGVKGAKLIVDDELIEKVDQYPYY